MVDNEDKRPVDGQPRRKSGERTGSASCGDIITALVNRHDRFLINLMMRKQTVQKIQNERKTQLSEHANVTDELRHVISAC